MLGSQWLTPGPAEHPRNRADTACPHPHQPGGLNTQAVLERTGLAPVPSRGGLRASKDGRAAPPGGRTKAGGGSSLPAGGTGAAGTHPTRNSSGRARAINEAAARQARRRRGRQRRRQAAPNPRAPAARVHSTARPWPCCRPPRPAAMPPRTRPPVCVTPPPSRPRPLLAAAPPAGHGASLPRGTGRGVTKDHSDRVTGGEEGIPHPTSAATGVPQLTSLHRKGGGPNVTSQIPGVRLGPRSGRV